MMKRQDLFSIIIFLLIGLSVNVSAVGRNDYYRLIKIRHSNGRMEQVSGNSGQFVCRDDKSCYDSNIYNGWVGNGTLVLVNREGSISKYIGPSYYGEDTSYTFDDSDGILNIRDDKGNVYVYRRETPPSGRVTSSLLKQPNWANNRPVTAADLPQSNYDSGNSISSSSSSSKKSSSRSKTDNGRMCTKCYGRGYCALCTGKGRYQPIASRADKVKCPSCNGTGICSRCGGTGRVR